MSESKEFGGFLFSNFDHCFEMDREEVKKNPDKYYQHSAYNYCGYIYYDIEKEKYIEEVWQYHSKMDVYENEDLEELILDVKDDYGYE